MSPHPAASVPFHTLGLIDVGSYPVEMAYDSGKGEVYVANDLGSNVSVISDTTNQVVATVNVGLAPFGIAYDPQKGELFVANSGSTNLSVISDASHTVSATIALPAGSLPTAVVYDSAKSTIWATTLGGATFVIADSNNTIVTNVTFPVANLGILGAAYDPHDGEVYLSSYNRSVVINVWDSNYSYGVIPVGSNPEDMVYDPVTGLLYVADTGSNRISTINATDNSEPPSPIGLIWEPSGIAYDAHDGFVLVSSANTSDVIVIADSTDTQVGSVSGYLGANPKGVVWDSTTETGYLANTALDVVSTFARATTVTFTERGLPSNSLWTAWLNGTPTQYAPEHTLWSSITTSIVAYLPNGSYSFALVPPAWYTAAPLTGPVTVAGSPVTESITFSELFNVTFLETGLPGGAPWSVDLNGSTLRSSTNTITFVEANGSYPFTIGALVGYRSTPTGGTVTVSGTDASRGIGFGAVFPLWFNESGLPAGSTWTIVLTGTGTSTGSMTNSSTTTSIGFEVPPGYQATFVASGPTGYTASPSSAGISTSASGVSTTESISFVANLKIVSFVATPGTVTVGAQLTLTVTISGGASPFTYAYVQLPSGCADQNASSLVCAPTATGRSIVIVTVSDRLGHSTEGNVTVEVNAASSSSNTVLGLPPVAAYGLIGAIIALVVVVALVVSLKGRKKPPAPSPPAGESPPASTAPPPP